MQDDLFQAARSLPEGFLYRSDFIDAEEARSLLAIIRALHLEEAQYRQYSARRRTLSDGSSYDLDTNEMRPAAPLPGFLDALRAATEELRYSVTLRTARKRDA
ncbi:MAG: hypothetical protein IT531_13915 [Burkholderiales bacterium]|nr:hypothetical protein [Burkholderiales bacterium]